MRLTDEQTKLNIRIVQLNNKSRKGTYIYIKTKGNRGSYYKYDDEDINMYLKYYENRIIKQDKKITLNKYKKLWKGETIKDKKLQTKVRQERKVMSKGVMIKETIKKGIHETRIDLNNTNQINIREKVKNLIEQAVTNKKNAELITNNISKLTNKITYDVTIMGINENGDYTSLAKFKDIGNRTPYDVINKYNKLFKTNDNISSNSWKEKISYLNKYNTNKINTESTKLYNGIIKQVRINMILRKE